MEGHYGPGLSEEAGPALCLVLLQSTRCPDASSYFFSARPPLLLSPRGGGPAQPILRPTAAARGPSSCAGKSSRPASGSARTSPAHASASAPGAGRRRSGGRARMVALGGSIGRAP